jgi:hypothetical protein
MPMRGFRRIALAPVLGVGCAIVLCGCLLIEHAKAQQQFVPPPPPPAPPPPAPVFNPSPSNTTVPQPSYKTISPTTPSAVPEDEVTSPVNEDLPPTAARAHKRTSVAKTVHHRGPTIYYRRRSIIAGPTPPYYYSPYAPYGCAWRRGWDGEWFRTSPCS